MFSQGFADNGLVPGVEIKKGEVAGSHMENCLCMAKVWK